VNHKTLSRRIVVLVVSLTTAVSFGPLLIQGEQETSKQRDLTKYPIVDFDSPADPSDAVEREKKNEKDKRYDKKPFMVQRPLPDYRGSTLHDYEPMPSSAFPFDQSKLVVSGVITDSKAVMSSKKTSVYSEYTIQIESILKQSGGQELQVGQIVSADRLGGRVRYSNGAVMLYRVDWHDLPEPNERYLFFLDNENSKNPNYKLVTAYKLTDESVTALDHSSKFHEHNKRKKSEFMTLVLDAAKGQ
jgi:hypothetical protein